MVSGWHGRVVVIWSIAISRVMGIVVVVVIVESIHPLEEITWSLGDGTFVKESSLIRLGSCGQGPTG